MFISVSRRLTSRSPSIFLSASYRRCLATTASSADHKAYSATLLLPKTTLPLKHKDAVAAELAYRTRTTDELYRSQVCCLLDVELISSGTTTLDRFSCFTMVLLTQMGICTWVGLPNESSAYISGHALNKILKDIITRYNVIRGRKVQ